jgi:diphosphomevalonate decarboxylase
LKENQKKISSRKSKVLGANRNLLAFLKDYHFTIDTQNTFPTVLNCFFGIRNGFADDELHEFGKVLNPKMTNAYFTKSIFTRLGSKCLPKCKRTSGSLGKPILKEALICTVEFPNTIHKNFKNYQDTILLVDKGKQVSSTRS